MKRNKQDGKFTFYLINSVEYGLKVKFCDLEKLL